MAKIAKIMEGSAWCYIILFTYRDYYLLMDESVFGLFLDIARDAAKGV